MHNLFPFRNFNGFSSISLIEFHGIYFFRYTWVGEVELSVDEGMGIEESAISGTILGKTKKGSAVKEEGGVALTEEKRKIVSWNTTSRERKVIWDSRSYSLYPLTGKR